MPIGNFSMQRKLDVFLWETRKYAREIVDLTASLTLSEYKQDRLAVERVFTILGECLVRMRKHFPNEFAMLDAGTPVVGFRNQLVHLYEQIGDEAVWQIIEDALPPMILQLTRMIEEQAS